MTTNLKIQVGKYFYTTTATSLVCCGEVQFTTLCEAHDEPQGCYFCDFDYDLPCECEVNN